MNTRPAAIFSIKEAIEIAYTNGITRLLDYQFKDGSVVGRFLDRARLYSFKISASGVEFQEIKPVRNDSYIVGYLAQVYGKQGLARMDQMEDWAAYLIRLDAANRGPKRKPKCEGGDECGGSCIEKGLRCNVKTGAAKAAAARVLSGVKLSSTVSTPPSAYTAIEADERKLRLNAYETAIVYDTQGKELLRKKGGSSEVSFTAAECAKMKDAIVTHNHPPLTTLDARYDGVYQGGSFSVTDMVSAAGLDVAEIRAVGPEGTYRLVRPAKGWPSAGTMNRVCLQKSEAAYGNELEKFRLGLKPIGESVIDHCASTVAETAKELGIEYSYRRTGMTNADLDAIDQTTATSRRQPKSDITGGIAQRWITAGVAASVVGVVAASAGMATAGGTARSAKRKKKAATEPNKPVGEFASEDKSPRRNGES